MRIHHTTDEETRSRPWWKNPAWWSIALLLLINLGAGIHAHGALTRQVDDLADQVRELRQELFLHIQAK